MDMPELRPGPLDIAKLHYWKKKQKAVATPARLAYASVQREDVKSVQF